MKVYPLIHSRTGACDYIGNFAVRPPSFNDTEIKWARSKILPATRNIGQFNGIRRVVASKGAICIAGVVCTMKYFVNNCLSGEDKNSAEPYASIQGTKYGVFLGCAFNKGDAPDLDDKTLWKWFEKYLADKWNKKSFDGVTSEPEDCDSLPRADYDFSPTEKCFGAEIYDAAAFDDEKLFKMYLFETANREVSFCSNVENIQRVEEGIYNAVTTSAGNIAALQKKTSPTPQTTVPTPANKISTPRHPQQSTPKSEKFPWKILLICLIILAAIIFCLTRPADDSKPNSATSRQVKLETQLFSPQKLSAIWRKFDEQTL